MRAIVVRAFGPPSVMKLEEVAAPEPGPGQVVVRVHAAGVNPSDTYARSGNYAAKPNLPYTPGSDAAGVIERVGAGVTRVKPGDRVYTARTVSGAYAELALADEAQAHALPARATFAQGAGVYVPYGTAFHALHHFARARAGETVLVHGASGGVGIASVQMARAMGLVVLGTAGTSEGRALAAREGAHRVFDHKDATYRDAILAATGGRGVDVILEMLANENLGRDLEMLAPRGRVVVIGSRGDVTITPRHLMMRSGSVHALLLWNITDAEARETHAALGAGLEDGTLRPVVGAEMPLADAPRAHDEVMNPTRGGALGKIVLVP